MQQHDLTIDHVLATIPTLGRDGIRRLARAGQRHLLEPQVPVATIEREAVAAASDDLATRVQTDRGRARTLLAARLAEFKELRADHTYKTAVNAAVDAAVLAIHGRDALPSGHADRLAAAWIEATGGRTGAGG